MLEQHFVWEKGDILWEEDPSSTPKKDQEVDGVFWTGGEHLLILGWILASL